MSAVREVKVYGASDDLIEVEGALSEEFSGGDGPRFLHFNEGTVLRVEYGPGKEGFWRIAAVKLGPTAYLWRSATNEESDYSDVVTLTGDITSVECWDSADGPTPDDLEEKIEAWVEGSPMRDVRNSTPEKLLALWRAIEAVA